MLIESGENYLTLYASYHDRLSLIMLPQNFHMTRRKTCSADFVYFFHPIALV